jgi:hypothetical protein
MNRIDFQRNGAEQGRSVVTRTYSPTTQRLQAHYSLTVRRRRLIKLLVGK